MSKKMKLLFVIMYVIVFLVFGWQLKILFADPFSRGSGINLLILAVVLLVSWWRYPWRRKR